MNASIDDAEQEGSLDDLVGGEVIAKQGPPVPGSVARLHQFRLRYHRCEDVEWNQAGIDEAGEDLVAS